MDFSFVDKPLQRKEGGQQRQQQQQQQQSSSKPPGSSPRIAIPSFRDIQAAEQRPAALNLFRPSGQLQQQQQQQQYAR